MLIVFRLFLMATFFMLPATLTPLPQDQMPQEFSEALKKDNLEELPVEEQTNRFLYEFIKMLIMLGGLIILLLAANWYVKRLGSQRDQKTNVESVIKIIEKRSLSPRSVVYLLEVDGKSILVGETPHGLIRLSEKLES